MSSKFFSNKNDKKEIVSKGTKTSQTKIVPKQNQIKKSGRGK